MSEPLEFCLPPPDAPRRLVACLCAAWCGTCRDYQQVMRQQAQQYPRDAFVWLDVEDQADLVDELDIETFPTILVVDARQILFYGPVLPGNGPLAQLLRVLEDSGPQPTAVDDDVLALAHRLRDRLPALT